MFDEIHRSEIVAVFVALLAEQHVEQPSWWVGRMRITLGGISATCALSVSGPGRVLLLPFEGTRAAALAAVTDPGASIAVWSDPLWERPAWAR